MATPLDELLDTPNPEQVAQQLQQVTPAGETPVQANRVKAADLASRGIPSFTDAYGDVAPVTDETGSPLTHLDKSHGIAYDSAGQPKSVSYDDEFGPPTVKDPFAGIPTTTDEKTGQQYQEVKGLPWKWVGTDQAVAGQRLQESKDKALKAESALVGQKLTLDHADLVSAGQEVKGLKKQLTDPLGGVPELSDPKYQGADLETVKKGIDDHFNKLYAAPEANATAGWFGDQLTPEAAALRAKLDQSKAAAHDTAERMFDAGAKVNDLADAVTSARGERRAATETLLAHQRGQEGPLDPGYQQAQFEQEQRQAFEEKKAALTPDAVRTAAENGDIPPQAAAASVAASHDAQDAFDKADKLQASNPSLADQFKAVGEGIVHGLAQGVGELARSPLGQGVRGIIDLATFGKTGMQPEQEQQVFGNRVKNLAPQVDARLKDTVGAKIGEFTGGMAPYALAAVAAPEAAAPAVLGSMFFSSGYQSTRDDALAHGASQQKADGVGLVNGAINAALAVPLGVVGKAYEAMFGSTAPKVIKEAITSAFQRGGAEAVGNIFNDLRGYIAGNVKPVIGGVAQDVKAQTLEAIDSIRTEMGKSMADRAATVAKTAAQHAAIGAGVQTAQNLVSKSYDPERGAFEGVPEQAIGFGALGGLSEGFRQVAMARNVKRALDVINRKGEPPPGTTLTNGPEPTEPTPPTEKVVTGKEVPPTSQPETKGGDNNGVQKGQPSTKSVDQEVESTRTPATKTEKENGNAVLTTKSRSVSADTVPEAERRLFNLTRDTAPNTLREARSEKDSPDYLDKLNAKIAAVSKARPPTTIAVGDSLSQEGTGRSVVQSTDATQTFLKTQAGGSIVSLPTQHLVDQIRSGEIRHEAAATQVNATDAGANEAATSTKNNLAEPTQAQKEAGNYKVGSIKVGGLDISIENPAGSKRKPEWAPLQSHYGYIKGTVGADKDHVDIFVKQGTPTDWNGPVFVVNQHKPVAPGKPLGPFDEHKAVIGVKNQSEALREYNANYEEGWRGGASVVKFDSPQAFKKWAESSDKGPAKATEGGRIATELLGLSHEQTQLRKLATGVLNQHKAILTSLGHTSAVEGPTSKGNTSGIETTPAGKIIFDWDKLHAATKDMAPRQRTKFIQRAVEEEVIHVAAHKWAGESPANLQKIKAWGGEKDELDQHLSGAYQGWEKLNDQQKGHEKLRAVLQQRWTGKLTEAAYRVLREFVKYLRGIWEKLTPDQRSMVSEVEARMGKVPDKAETEPDFITEEYKGKGGATKIRVIDGIQLAERRSHRQQLEKRIADLGDKMPATTRQLLRTLLQSGPRKEPSVSALQQAERKIAPLEKPNATTTGKEQSSTETELSGVPPGTDLRPHKGEIREKEGGQAGGGSSPVERPTTPAEPSTRQPDEAANVSALSEAAQKEMRDAFEGLSAALPVQSIKAPAIRLKDGTIVNVPEGGMMWHASAVDASIEKHGAIATKDFEKGYITTNGHFLTKDQAYKLARIGSSTDLEDAQRFATGAADPLIGAAVVPIVQKPIPDDKIAAFVNLARTLIKEGIDTPEKLARELDRLIPKVGRSYAESVWDMMATHNKALRGTHDWTKVFNGLGASQRPNLEPDARPPGGGVAPKTGVSSEGGSTGGVPKLGNAEHPQGNGPATDEKPADDTGRGAGTGVTDVVDTDKPATQPEQTDVTGEPAKTDTVSGEGASTRRGGVTAPHAFENHFIAPDDVIAPKGAITKARANLSAIRLLKKLEAEDRFATPEEKKILAAYTGWGGIPQVFDSSQARYRDYGAGAEWAKKYGSIYDQLKELLTDDEYEAARSSTQFAHYTSREVISSMWDAARRLGFKGGTVAEYGAGIGHFFGLMPREMEEKSKLQAIERDPLSARILEKLYPGARVRTGSLQDIRTKPNSVDLFVGNVPFSNEGPRDKRYPTLNLHNYFIARELDDLKPGGLAIVISTANTLDSQQEQRAFLAEKAELIGAIRLPNTAFKENANTEVNTDILFFRKPDSQRPAPEPFVGTVDLPVYNAGTKDLSKNTQPVTMNEYFGRHPEMILGLVSREGSMYGPDQPAVIPFPGEDLPDLLTKAIDKLPKNIAGATTQPSPDTLDEEHVAANAEDKIGSLIYRDRKLYVVSDTKQLVPAGTVNPRLKPTEVVKRAKDFVGLREAYKDLLALQLRPDTTDEGLAVARADLNRQYDAYVKRHGHLNDLKSRVFSGDPEFGLMASLEDRRSTTKDGKRVYTFDKAAVFTKRTQFPFSEPKFAANVRDGMLASLGYRGRIISEYISALTGQTVEQVEATLEGDNLAYRDPESGNWHSNDHYLTGNVRVKLREAEYALESDPRYQRNVDALKKAQPAPIPMGDINARFGGAWIPPDVVTQFGRKLFNAPTFQAKYVKAVDTWVSDSQLYTPEATSTYAGGGMSGPSLFKLTLNLKQAKVYDRVWDGSNWKQVFNPTKTAAAQAAQDKISAEFKRFIGENTDAADKLEAAYNEAFNGHVLATYDGSHLTLPGSSTAVQLRPLQKNAIWRIIQDGYAMLAHAVGAGKTYEMIGAAMEMRRLGLARKPMIVVKNPTLPQFAASFRKMYPSANVLVGSKEDLSAANRNKFMARIASGDWDAVVVAQSSFDRLPNDPAREVAYIRRQLEELVAAIKEASARDNKRDPSVKALEKQRDKLRERLKELQDRPKDNNINFEQMGVDALFIDEAHDYKKPPFVTKLDRVGGLNTQASKRGFALLMKTLFIQEKNKGRNVILATGTPVTNTLGEAWHMLNLGAPHLLAEYNVATFDRFVSTFATIEPSMEVNAAGNWVIKPRLAKFVNGPELLTMIRSGWDVVTTEELHKMFGELNIDVPKVKGGKVRPIVVERTPPVTEYVHFLQDVYREYQASSRKRDISYVPIMAYMSGRVCALDPRLIDAAAHDHPKSKVNVAVGEILRVYNDTTPNKSTQLVFAENYRPMNVTLLRQFAAGKGIEVDMSGGDIPLDMPEGGFNLFLDIKKKLIAGGVKPEEIALINDFDTEKQKEQLFDAMNAGSVRVLLGGTQKMGVGVNVQQKLIALHHLDAPWMPADLEQREGRAIRQGNEHPEVELLSYGMKNTLDAGLYTKIAAKAKFLRQVLGGKFTGRDFDDPTGPLILSAQEQQALLSGNPLVLKKVEVDNKVRNLALEYEGWEAGKTETRQRLRRSRAYVEEQKRDLAAFDSVLESLKTAIDGENWQAKIGAQELNDKKQIIATLDRIIAKAQVTKDVDFHDPSTLARQGNKIVEFKLNGVDVTLYGGLYSDLGGGPPEPRFGSIMKMNDVRVYSGFAKTGIGLVNTVSELPSEVEADIAKGRQGIAQEEADIEKFLKIIDEPFEKEAEYRALLAEQERINKALLGEDEKEKGDKELFDIGYSAIPLLQRIDAQLTKAYAAQDELENSPNFVESEKLDAIELRIKALRTRRQFVEKKRYTAALNGELTVPYAWTPTGDESRPLSAAAPVATYYKDEVKPFLDKLNMSVNELWGAIVHTLSPTSGVRPDAIDAVMKLRGKRDQTNFALHQILQGFERAFERMGRDEQISFVDRVKRGEEQPSPELQKVADLLRRIDTDSWKALAQAYLDAGYKEDELPISWLDNHFRVLWKTLPGAEGPDVKATPGRSKRPLRGTRGMLKQHTLADMSEGIENGGVPFSYNPITLFKMAQADIWKLTTAVKMWNWARENQFAQYVKGSFPQQPEGFVWLDDNISRVYFSAPGGLVEPGRYAVEEGFGRILNNYLSRDLIRATQSGRSLLWVKNFTTSMELALSAFHAVFETLETVGSNIGLGLSKIANRGALFEGLMDILKAPTSFVGAAKEGSVIKRMAADPDAFFKTAEGQQMLKDYPNARQYADDLFTGGWKPVEVEADWKNQSIRAFVESAINIKTNNSHNYIGPVVRALPALNEWLMKPLFDHYIPNLKLGQWFKEYHEALLQADKKYPNGYYIDRSGKRFERPSNATIARQVWRFIEDRFGELNYDTLFWNNTFKTGMQLLFRSVTWKFGSVEAFSGAFAGQAKEFMDAMRERRAPEMHRNAAWALGMFLLTCALGYIISKTFGNKDPKNLTDFVFPQIDERDPHVRLSIPTYFKDAVHLVHSPIGYAKSSMAGWIGRVADLLSNKDYYGVQIRNTDDPLVKQALQVGTYAGQTILPFSIRGYQQLSSNQVSTVRKSLSLLGANPAPRYIGQTAAERKVDEIMTGKKSEAGVSPEQFEKSKEKRALVAELRHGKPADISGALTRGVLKPRDVGPLYKRAQMGQLASSINYMTLPEAESVYKRATAGEKAELAGIIERKRQGSRARAGTAGKTIFTGF